MSNESQVMALLAEGNPATQVDDAKWLDTNAAAYLAALQTRSSDMTELYTGRSERSTTERSIPPSEVPKKGSERRWRPSLVAAVFVAVVLVGAILALTGLLRSDDAPDFSNPQSVAEGYIARFNTGDTEAMMDMFTVDAVLGLDGAGLDLTPAQFEAWLAYDAGQESTFVLSRCVADGARHVCDASFLDAVAENAGWEPGVFQFTMELVADGITSINQSFRPPDGASLSPVDPFFQWMFANHREDLRAVGCCFDNDSEDPQATISVEAARDAGELRREYADEWGVMLADSGCEASDVDCQREFYSTDE